MPLQTLALDPSLLASSPSMQVPLQKQHIPGPGLKCQPLSLHPSSLPKWAKEGTGRTRLTLTRESELPVVWCPWTVWPVYNSVGSKEGHQAGGWFSVPTFPQVSNQHLHFWLAKYITFIKTKLFSPLGSATPDRSCLLPRAGRWRVHWAQGLEVRDWFRIEACGEKHTPGL